MSQEINKAPAEGGQAGAVPEAPIPEIIYARANKIENMKPVYTIEIDDVLGGVRYEVYDDGWYVFRDPLEDVVEFGVWDYV